MSTPTPILGKLTPLIPSGKDMSATVAFYEQKLGFTIAYQDENMAILQRGDAEIIINDFDDPHVASQTSFRIQVSEVDTLYAEYQTQAIAPFELGEGAGLGRLTNTPWGTREFAVRDLAGVCIAFYQRT